MRINVGCGQTPTPGWRNFDNSLSLRLARVPALASLLRRMRLIGAAQHQFIQFARGNAIEFGDVTRGLPVADGSCEVLYTSHMLEHLDREEARTFLKEALRVLRPGGVLRISVPDIRIQVARYNQTGDADAFVEGAHMCAPRPRSLADRLRLLFVGARHHHWMYDGPSLCRLLEAHGFVNAAVMPAGSSTIPDPDPLDLHERASESVYVEARKPGV